MAAPVIINPPSSATDSIYPNNVFPPNYINGLNLTHVDDETITIGTGSCKSSDGTIDITLDAELTLDNLVSGDLGIDIGSVGNTTWYYPYVIYDSTNDITSALLSESSTTPTLPGSYDKYRRVGSVVTDGTADFIDFIQVGNGMEREYFWENIMSPTTNILSVGTSSPAWSTATAGGLAASDFVPETATKQYLDAMVQGVGGSLSLRPDGGSDIFIFISKGDVAPFNGACPSLPIGPTRQIEYKTIGTAHIWMLGYTESL